MTPELEFLKSEAGRAEDAELESEEQLRHLTGLIAKASAPNPEITASDCAKLVSAALALNERLRERAEALHSKVRRAVAAAAAGQPRGQ